MLQEIEARLRQPVPAVNADLSLPQEIAKRIFASPGLAEAVYGQHKEHDASQVSFPQLNLSNQ